jgi:Flp pilus assembly protein TadD
MRGLLVVGAAAVVAWLVFSIHGVDLQADGEATLKRAQTGTVSGDEIDSALLDLRRADRYNPDLTPLIDQGFLLAQVGRHEEALAAGLKAAAKEPQNVQGWTLIDRAAPGTEVAARARRRVAELNPWLADALR